MWDIVLQSFSYGPHPSPLKHLQNLHQHPRKDDAIFPNAYNLLV